VPAVRSKPRTPPPQSPVGTVRLRDAGNGQLVRMVKIRLDGVSGLRWIPFAKWWWERNRGPVPAGRRICHADGDLLNDEPSNLVALTPGEVFNLYHRLDPEMSRRNHAACGRAAARLNRERSRRRREAQWFPLRWYAVDFATHRIHNVPRRMRWMVYHDHGLADVIGRSFAEHVAAAKAGDVDAARFVLRQTATIRHWWRWVRQAAMGWPGVAVATAPETERQQKDAGPWSRRTRRNNGKARTVYPTLRQEIAKAEKSKEKFSSWDSTGRREIDEKVAGLRQPGAGRAVDDPGHGQSPRARRRGGDDPPGPVAQTLGLQQRVGLRDAGDGTFELIWGSRRLAATKRNGEEIPAKVYPSDAHGAEVEILRTIENFGRKELTHVERAIAVARTIDAIERTLAPLTRETGTPARPSRRRRREGAPRSRAVDRPEKAFKGRPELIDAARLSQAIDAAGGIEAYVGQQLGFPPKWVKDNAYVSKLGGKARELLAAHRIDVGHARELAKLGDPGAGDDIAEDCARDESGLGGATWTYCRQRVVESLRSLKVVPGGSTSRSAPGKPGCTGQACATCKFNSKSGPGPVRRRVADEPARRLHERDLLPRQAGDLREGPRQRRNSTPRSRRRREGRRRAAAAPRATSRRPRRSPKGNSMTRCPSGATASRRSWSRHWPTRRCGWRPWA
jgi:hypothetical protein